MKKRWMRVGRLGLVALLLAAIAPTGPAGAQDRLKAMPGHARFEAMSKEIPGAMGSGSLRVSGRDGGKAFEFGKDGKSSRYEIAAGKGVGAPPSPSEPSTRGGRGGRGGPD